MIHSSDPTTHQLTFEPENATTHYCYHPQVEPYISQQNSASIQLTSPIPLEGTLLIAHSEDGRNHFSLRIQNYLIVFEYVTTDNETRSLTLNSPLERCNITYQVDLYTSFNSAELVLSTVTNNESFEVIRANSAIGDILYPSKTIFTTVCLGGSLLEFSNYVGTMQNSFFGYNSLVERRNFCQLDIEAVSRSDVISFVNNGIPRSLTFNRFSLRSHNISFQARYPVGIVAGAVLVAENLPYQFFVSIIGANGGLFLGLRNVQTGQLISSFECVSLPLADGEWHFLEIMTDLDPAGPSITVLLDRSRCSFDSATEPIGPILMGVADAPLQFGATNDFINVGPTVSIFTGCVSDINLQATIGSESFRPNLEAVPRTNAQFDLSSCYHCNLGCTNNQVCTDRGFGLEPECACPLGKAGSMCQGKEVVMCYPSLHVKLTFEIIQASKFKLQLK